QLIRGPDGHALVGEGQKSGTYWAFDRRTLRPAWNTTIGPSASFAGGIVGSTAYDGNRIYGPNTPAGEMWALGRGGQLAWVSSDGGPLHFSPVSVANGGGARLRHLLVLDVLPGQATALLRGGEPHERARPALRRAEERASDRRQHLPDAVLVLAEAGAHHAGVKAVRVQPGLARGELPREQDVAELRRSVHPHRRVRLLRLEIVEVEPAAGMGIRGGRHHAPAREPVE